MERLRGAFGPPGGQATAIGIMVIIHECRNREPLSFGTGILEQMQNGPASYPQGLVDPDPIDQAKLEPTVHGPFGDPQE